MVGTPDQKKRKLIGKRKMNTEGESSRTVKARGANLLPSVMIKVEDDPPVHRDEQGSPLKVGASIPTSSIESRNMDAKANLGSAGDDDLLKSMMGTSSRRLEKENPERMQKKETSMPSFRWTVDRFFTDVGNLKSALVTALEKHDAVKAELDALKAEVSETVGLLAKKLDRWRSLLVQDHSIMISKT